MIFLLSMAEWDLHTVLLEVCAVKYAFWTGLELRIRKCGTGHCKFEKHPVSKVTKKRMSSLMNS